MLPKGLVKKKYRKIVVDNQVFAWHLSESFPIDYGIGIRILHISKKTAITGLIKKKYHQLPKFDVNGKSTGVIGIPALLTIKPAYIKALIEYTMSKGWNYLKDYHIHTNDNILTNCQKEFKFPVLVDSEVAVIAYQKNTLLNCNLELFKSEVNMFLQFDRLSTAEAFGLSKCLENKEFTFWILDHKQSAIALVSDEGVKRFPSNIKDSQ